MSNTQKPALRLYTFDGGRVITNGVRFLDRDGSEEIRDMADPNHCYLIEHPHGRLLWDTGLADTICDLPNHTLERGRFHFVVEQKLSNQIAELGLAPADIQFLTFSHLQIDHAGNAGLFPDATVLIQAAEHKMAFSADADDWGYHTTDYAALNERSVIQIRGDYDVFGDGSVIILSAPGHTPGHQVLLVNLPESGPLLLSGDLYYAQKDPTNGWMPAWNYDKEETQRTMTRLEALVRDRGARWIINHDPQGDGTGWHA